MPRMTSWNWLNIKDSRQFSLQHGRQRGITPANFVLQGTIVCIDPNIFCLWDMVTLYKLNLIFFRFRKHKCLAIDSSSQILNSLKQSNEVKKTHIYNCSVIFYSIFVLDLMKLSNKIYSRHLNKLLINVLLRII